jgi:hypothetical protein
MKKFLCLSISLALTFSLAFAQEEESSPVNWEFSTDVNFYFIPEEFFVLPVFRADKDKLHLEARYNYEDLETFSVWVGYNINGGKEFEYTFTPMIGGVAGLANGVAAGLEITLGFRRFELYSESEYMFDFEIENFFYNWSDLTYSPTEWLWLGISGQRTRVYQSDLEVQRGLLLGGGYKNWELSTYFYNIGMDESFVIVTISANF